MMPVAQAVMRRVWWRRCTMPRVTICYGMTETSPVSFQSQPDDVRSSARRQTVGAYTRTLQVKDIERGQSSPARVGGIVAAATAVCAVTGRPERRRTYRTAGGLGCHTGDLGSSTTIGYCKQSSAA